MCWHWVRSSVRLGRTQWGMSMIPHCRVCRTPTHAEHHVRGDHSHPASRRLVRTTGGLDCLWLAFGGEDVLGKRLRPLVAHHLPPMALAGCSTQILQVTLARQDQRRPRHSADTHTLDRGSCILGRAENPRKQRAEPRHLHHHPKTCDREGTLPGRRYPSRRG